MRVAKKRGQNQPETAKRRDLPAGRRYDRTGGARRLANRKLFFECPHLSTLGIEEFLRIFAG